MSNIDALEYEEIIGTYETIKDTPLKGIDFYKRSFVDVDGDTAHWDEYTTVRLADSEFSSRGDPSTSKDLANMRPRTAAMAYFNTSFIATGDNLNNLRKPGSNVKDKAGKAYLAKNLMEVKDMERRAQERLLFSCLTGTLTYTLNDVAQSQTMSVPAGNTTNPTTSWATAGTDIITDLLGYKAIVEEGSGRVLTTGWVNDTVMGYLLNNTSIQSLIGTGTLTERIAKTGNIGVIAGINFIQYDGAYYNGSATAKYVSDDVVFMTPDPADWLTYQRGSVAIADGEEMRIVASPGIWGVTNKDPVGEKVIVKSCFLPVLTAPASVVYLSDVTP